MPRQILFSVTKKDFRIETFPAGGPGGQKQNKTASAVRITHPDSGAVGECRNHRSQHQNRAEALRRLVEQPKWKVWHSNKVRELTTGKTMAQRVDEAMQPEHLKIEFKVNGRWAEEQTK